MASSTPNNGEPSLEEKRSEFKQQALEATHIMRILETQLSTFNSGEPSLEEQFALQVAKMNDLIDKAKAAMGNKERSEFKQHALEANAIVRKLETQLGIKKESAETSTTAFSKGEDTAATMPPEPTAKEVTPEHKDGDLKAEMMRSMLIGRQVKNYQTDDLLETLNDDEISNVLNGLTPSQKSLFTGYLRRVINGVALCEGPFGTGKTAIIKVLAQIMAKGNKRMLCVTSGNAGCDHIAECLKQGQLDLFCIRLHAMGLAVRPITEHARHDSEGILLPADPLKDPVEGWNHDDIVIKYTQHLMHTAEQKWRQQATLTNPRDHRMVLDESAMLTYILKFIGVIPSSFNTKYWSDLVSVYEKSKTQLLNNHERRLFSKDLLAVEKDIVNKARVIVCTPAQLASPLVENIDFDLGFIDDATTMNEAEFVMVWKVCRNVLAVGDFKQPGVTLMSTAANNPFHAQLETSFFTRLIMIGWGFHAMVETMRATKGLVDLPNHLFYDNTLISGPGTDLKDREISQKWRALASRLYPHLIPEPAGRVYPVFLNVPGSCKPPFTGALSFHNLHNVAVAWELIDRILEAEVVTTKDIGICCPYAAQVAAHHRVGRARGGEFRNVRVGTVEFWRGREAFVMISDAVRAENDMETSGFFSDPKPMNVWMSRCQHAQILIGNTLCVKPPIVDSKETFKASKKLEKQNKHLVKMFKWLESKGRIARISIANIPRSDVDYDEL